MIDYWNLLKKWLTQGGHYSILIKSVVSSAYNEGQAAVAQLVERRLGKAEVTGPTPVSSSNINSSSDELEFFLKVFVSERVLTGLAVLISEP